MIKAVILDIDGVIVGEKIGFNSPHPHPDILQKMQTVCARNIPIILCTAKPHYAIQDIIQGAYLHNPHITDAGAVIIDPINNLIIEEHPLPKNLVKDVLDTCLKHTIYVECYTTQQYYIQKSQESDITKRHTHILQKKPTSVTSLVTAVKDENVTKIMPIAVNRQDSERVNELLQPFTSKASISWGIHPIALPLQFGIVTAKGCSKKEAVEGVIRRMGLALEDVLSVGDSTSDWQFMQLCGYAATVKNGSDEIKSLVKTKKKGHYVIGPSVDQNGLIKILDYFRL